MPDITAHVALTEQFEAGLATMAYELKKGLYEADVSNQFELSRALALFNDRLIIFQHSFLKHAAAYRLAPNAPVTDFQFTVPPPKDAGEMAAAVIASGTGAILVTLIPITTSSWAWVGAVTTGAAVGASVGIPIGAITAGLGLVAGGILGVGSVILFSNRRREAIRQSILRKYADDIVPRLRQWATAQIAALSATPHEALGNTTAEPEA